MRRRLAILLSLLLVFGAIPSAQGPIPPSGPSGFPVWIQPPVFIYINNSGTVSGPLYLPNGTLCTVPSLAFSSSPTSGIVRQGADAFSMCNAAVETWRFLANGNLTGVGGGTFTSTAIVSSTSVTAGGASGSSLNGTALVVGSSTATTAQYRSTQTQAPDCYVNCGTSPSVVGTDSDMIVTMGSSGVPASLWQVGFRGTWAAAPSCTGTMALTGMAIGKFPMVIVTTVGGLTVTTNGTSPSTSDKYAIHCHGVS